MLHLGILPNHHTWTRFLRGLRYVVLDESHVYRGVFGSHVANVIRRLRRLCRLYGSSPQFILCSATIANAGELARQLTGLPFTAIEVDGAPYGGKRFVFWNPPLTDANRTSRRSTNIEASTLFSELVGSSIRTITFVRTRKVAELVYLYAREQLNATQPAMAEKISPYRASYLPEDRRRIERALFDGELMGVSTTNALELGIDVGTLDATVIAGYPGSIASTWQQAGRSGRRNEESLSVLVGQGNPLDQYLMNYPHTFFSKPVEHALISPGNPYILQPHVLCAAYEAPLGPGDEELFGPELPEALARLEEGGLVNNEGDRWYASTAVGYPAESVNIRSTSSRGYLVVDERSGAILERVEEASVFHQLHPGAVYLHQGESYLVADLDLESQIAYVEPNDGSYYTQVHDMTDIEIREVRASKKAGGVSVFGGGGGGDQPGVGIPAAQTHDRGAAGRGVPGPARTPVQHRGPMVRRSPGRAGHRARAAHGPGRRAARRGARGHRSPAPFRPVRPQRHRRGLHLPAPGHGEAPGLHLRRASRRDRHLRKGIRGHTGPVGSDTPGGSAVPVRRRMPKLHPVSQVREQQQPAGQGRRRPHAAVPVRVVAPGPSQHGPRMDRIGPPAVPPVGWELLARAERGVGGWAQ